MADTVKHTDYPWERVDTADYAEIHPVGKRLQSAIALVGKPDDANLIAAAPELLLALQELLDAYSKPDERLCCDGRDCGCMGSTVHQQAEHYARAAIAKATGGQ